MATTSCNIEFGEIISVGSSSQVRRATFAGKTVAVKSSLSSKPSSCMLLKQEESFLSKLSGCEHVVRRLGKAQSKDEKGKAVFHLIMEHAEGGSLDKYILKEGSGLLAEEQVRRLARSIAQGLAYIHSKNYVHCDIRPENILLTDCSSRAQIKICDFGMAKRAGEKAAVMGTSPRYMSLEAMKGRYEAPMDVFGLGCIVLELLAGKDALSKLRAGAIVMHDLLATISDSGQHFLGCCITRNASVRWTADMLLRHSSFLRVDEDVGEEGSTDILKDDHEKLDVKKRKMNDGTPIVSCAKELVSNKSPTDFTITPGF